MSQRYAAGVGDSARGMVETVLSAAPKVVLFLLILGVGWIAARALAAGVGGLLDRFGLDRAAERGGVRRWTGTYEPSELFAKLTLYAVLLFTLQTAFGVFGTNPVSDIITAVVGILPQVFLALLIVVVVAAIASAVRDLIRSALDGLTYGRALGTAAQIVVLTLGVIAALNQVEVATAVTTPVLIAILATVGGVVVVGAGGGLIDPMRRRWERVLDTVEREAATAAVQVARNAERRREIAAAHPAVAPHHLASGLNDEYRTSEYRNGREYRTAGHRPNGSGGYRAHEPGTPARFAGPTGGRRTEAAAGGAAGYAAGFAGGHGHALGRTSEAAGPDFGYAAQEADRAAAFTAPVPGYPIGGPAGGTARDIADDVIRRAGDGPAGERADDPADLTDDPADDRADDRADNSADDSADNSAHGVTNRPYRAAGHPFADPRGHVRPIGIGDYRDHPFAGRHISGETREIHQRELSPVPAPSMTPADQLRSVAEGAGAPAPGATPGWDDDEMQVGHAPVGTLPVGQEEFDEADELDRPVYWIEPVHQEAHSSIYRGQSYGR